MGFLRVRGPMKEQERLSDRRDKEQMGGHILLYHGVLILVAIHTIVIKIGIFY